MRLIARMTMVMALMLGADVTRAHAQATGQITGMVSDTSGACCPA